MVLLETMSGGISEDSATPLTFMVISGVDAQAMPESNKDMATTINTTFAIRFNITLPG